MSKNHRFNGGLLGDPQSTVTFTNGNGQTVTVPADQAGDIFAGDVSDDDGEANMGDISHLLGDHHIESLHSMAGDIFAGDVAKAPKWGSFFKQSPNVGTGQDRVAVNQASKTAAAVLKTIPGAVISTKALSPIIINKGMINNAPTRALIPGAALVDTIRRAETSYPGTTRTQTQVGASGTVTFTFAAPTVAEGGNVARVPCILVQLSTQRNYSVPNAEIGASLSAINEAGIAVASNQWTILLSESLDSTFFVFIPYTEISSTLFPAIVYATVGNNLVLTLTGIPSNSNVRVVLPGADSAQYSRFKQGFGIATPTTQLIQTTNQG